MSPVVHDVVQENLLSFIRSYLGDETTTCFRRINGTLLPLPAPLAGIEARSDFLVSSVP